MGLFELHHRPELREPVMITFFEGFIDAGGAASMATRLIVDQEVNEPLATFDSEALLDYRARRPIMHLVDGVMTQLTWPTIRLLQRRDRHGNAVLVLTGPEPDHYWSGFSRAVRDLALEFDVRMVLNLGSYPAAAPHTRPPRLSATSTDADLAHQIGFVNATLEIPSGIHAAIEFECASHGIPAAGLWVQVPHYLANMPYPASAVALFDGLRIFAGLDFDLSELHQLAASAHVQITDLIARSEEHEQMVRQLELQDDASRDTTGTGDLPSGDEIAAELEQFLRDQED